MASVIDPPQVLDAWKNLERLAVEQRTNNIQISELFERDAERFQSFSIEAAGILYDFSKQSLTAKSLGFLQNLAKESKLQDQIQSCLSGDSINITENRAVLHSLLRAEKQDEIAIRNPDKYREVQSELQRIESFSGQIRGGQWLGYSGKKITTVVNIGIGGSHLGPKMVADALLAGMDAKVNQILDTQYVSTVDSFQIESTLAKLNPETSLFIISSKSFSTKETLFNARVAFEWFKVNTPNETPLNQHFVAVTSNVEKAEEFGIPSCNLFKMWDWVGGRFSVWSAVGVSIALKYGFNIFRRFLNGANQLDRHFYDAPIERNMPVLMALVGIWNRNFLGHNSLAILPYMQALEFLPAYLQQVEMESNGKSVHLDGSPVEIDTGLIVWGQTGIDGQHAFYQMLHQGTAVIPTDFVIAAHSVFELNDHHRYLLANFLAQSRALMMGKSYNQVAIDMESKGSSSEEISAIANHRVHVGNKPSSTIVLDDMSPENIGALIALYEHKVLVQGIIWKICSFDQWGVELGKVMADELMPLLQSSDHFDSDELEKPSLDQSTIGLLKHIERMGKNSR